ncbi:MAG: hypothetical protein BWY43_00651 [candidate division WS2 bacterium ADurb.Bin280]|uniref:TrbC/VIRB2 family protein n=1 Tax=candidate division WS2 bacterium ADurb.Bin280 TaxID=1852829 RepID=A0A1V5SCS5_9BACT|nr:MAG: hypothetical protein BWY43_00651 [candidate division WS2 bacterium ADurb.Bin280]
MIKTVKSIGGKIAAVAIMAGAYGTSALAANSTTINGNQINALKLSNLSMEEFLSNAMSIILLLAGILAVAYLIYGGILYVTAGGDSEKAGKGRVAITNAIIGIILIILALVIYNSVTSAVTKGNL